MIKQAHFNHVNANVATVTDLTTGSTFKDRTVGRLWDMQRSRPNEPNADIRSVVWAESLGLLVAVGWTGIGNRVMTSPDGVTWTT
jgi:hypothetical protein